MATGYTSGITENTSFQEFVFGCARAFGALIHMRDDPASAAFPDRVEVDSYVWETVRRCKDTLARMEALSDNDLRMVFREEQQRRMEERIEVRQKKRALKRSYERMLAMVHAWTPPTSEHVELKSFMHSQLSDSIRWDCDERGYETEPETPKFEDWKKERLSDLRRGVFLAEKNLEDAIKTAESRTKWIQVLRASLQGSPQEKA